MSTSIPSNIAYGPHAFLHYKGQRVRLVSLRCDGTEWSAETEPRNSDVEAAMITAAKKEKFGNPDLKTIQNILDKG